MLYLLHFDRPYKHARHYLGFAEDEETLRSRLEEHKHGRGARLVEVITLAGIGFTVSAILPGDYEEWHRLKRAHRDRMCPICLRAKYGLGEKC